MNRWNIPAVLEHEVLQRDLQCIYCGVSFLSPASLRRERASWEHIINDETLISRENIARCCIGCNASKGQKTLASWLHSRYCQRHGITRESIAGVARAALAAAESTASSGRAC